MVKDTARSKGDRATIAHKICIQCGREKPIGQFGQNRHAADGRQTRCKTCANAARKPSKSNLSTAIKKGDLKTIAAHLPSSAERILQKAAEYGQREVIEYLLQQGPYRALDAALVACVMPKATIAVTEANTHISELLLRAGASADARGGWSDDRALLWACYGGFAELSNLLVKSGATVDPCAQAALGDAKALRRSLQKASTAAHTADANGLCPLHCCARSALGNADADSAQDLVRCSETLLDAGAEIDAPDQPPPHVKFPQRRTPLHWAAAAGNFAVGRLLIARGADVSARSASGLGSALGSAVSTCPDLAELLLAAGAEIDARDGDGATLLHLMANKPHVREVAWLLARGADPNAQMTDGRTPLHRAAERNASARAAQMLVEAGARADIRDAADMTPLDYAIEKNKTKVAHYLRDL